MLKAMALNLHFGGDNSKIRIVTITIMRDTKVVYHCSASCCNRSIIDIFCLKISSTRAFVRLLATVSESSA